MKPEYLALVVGVCWSFLPVVPSLEAQEAPRTVVEVLRARERLLREYVQAGHSRRSEIIEELGGLRARSSSETDTKPVRPGEAPLKLIRTEPVFLPPLQPIEWFQPPKIEFLRSPAFEFPEKLRPVVPPPWEPLKPLPFLWSEKPRPIGRGVSVGLGAEAGGRER